MNVLRILYPIDPDVYCSRESKTVEIENCCSTAIPHATAITVMKALKSECLTVNKGHLLDCIFGLKSLEMFTRAPTL